MWDRENYQKATTSLVLLSILQKGEKNGFELMDEMRAATNNEYSQPLGCLFAFLYPMKDAGYIKIDRKNRCTLYRLTPKGNTYLLTCQKEFQLIDQGLRNVLAQNTAK